MKNVICHDIVAEIIHFRSLCDVTDHPMLILAFSTLTTGISDSEHLGERENKKPARFFNNKTVVDAVTELGGDSELGNIVWKHP